MTTGSSDGASVRVFLCRVRMHAVCGPCKYYRLKVSAGRHTGRVLVFCRSGYINQTLDGLVALACGSVYRCLPVYDLRGWVCLNTHSQYQPLTAQSDRLCAPGQADRPGWLLTFKVLIFFRLLLLLQAAWAAESAFVAGSALEWACVSMLVEYCCCMGVRASQQPG